MTSTMLKQEQNYFVRHTRAIISLSGNSGPIDLSIMAVSSECYLQRLEENQSLYLLLLVYHQKHLTAISMIVTQDLKTDKNLFSSLKSRIKKTHPSSISSI